MLDFLLNLFKDVDSTDGYDIADSISDFDVTELSESASTHEALSLINGEGLDSPQILDDNTDFEMQELNTDSSTYEPSFEGSQAEDNSKYGNSYNEQRIRELISQQKDYEKSLQRAITNGDASLISKYENKIDTIIGQIKDHQSRIH